MYFCCCLKARVKLFGPILVEFEQHLYIKIDARKVVWRFFKNQSHLDQYPKVLIRSKGSMVYIKYKSTKTRAPGPDLGT